MMSGKNEAAQKRLDEIMEKLEQGVKDVFTSDKYVKYLSTMAKFHDYSFNNILLIAMQRPDATLIAGYQAWKKNFGRNVMQGEKGIRILAPSPYKIKQNVEKKDSVTGKTLIGNDGKPVMEEKEVTIPAYKVVTVFDVSQTEGKELPTIADELTGDVKQYEDFFAALERTSPVPIGFEKIKGGAHGYYRLDEKRIAIDEGMSELQNLKTAIHEMAHAKMHDIDLNASPEQQQARPDRRTREVQAESVAYIVCQHYGLETSDYSFEYIATWSSGREIAELKESLTVIRNTASELIKDIDKNLAELTKNKEQAQETVEVGMTVKEIDSVEVSINDFLDNLAKNNKDGMLNALYNAPIVVNPASFTKNGNTVESQEALLKKGENCISVRFYNQWDPIQIGVPAKDIKQTIGIVLYKNGNATAIRTLAEKKSMSLKNAERNYREMLKQWKGLTKQQEIAFDSVVEQKSNESVLDKLHENREKIMQSRNNIEKSDRRMER